MNAVLFPVAVVSVIGVISGIILTVAAKFMSVPVDERAAAVREVLPGANCGACGFAGCDEYAEKLVHTGAPSNLCTPGGSGVSAQIAGLLGVAAEDVLAKRAVVHCAGTPEHTADRMDYQGPRTCEGSHAFYGGRKRCSHACQGFGDCVQACRYDAIHMVDGVAVVDPDVCSGCGMCVERCPSHLIQIVPGSSQVFVCCSSTDPGGVVRGHCKVGCIGCKRCEKTCQYGAVVVQNNLASIDPVKCTGCGDCISVCPTNTIWKTVCRDFQEIL